MLILLVQLLLLLLLFQIVWLAGINKSSMYISASGEDTQ
jgi:hypothetical protein